MSVKLCFVLSDIESCPKDHMVVWFPLQYSRLFDHIKIIRLQRNGVFVSSSTVKQMTDLECKLGAKTCILFICCFSSHDE